MSILTNFPLGDPRSWISLFSLVFLLGIAVCQVFARERMAKLIRPAMWFSIAVVFGLCMYLSYEVYLAWKSSAIGQYTLPPHQPISYFFGYVSFRIFAEYAASFVAALGLVALLKKLNVRYGGHFFEDDEMHAAALGAFLTGWPSLMVYVAVVLCGGVLGSLVRAVQARLRKQEEPDRFPLYYIWIPAAVIVLLSRTWLMDSSFWVLGFARTF